jgi:2-methylcitrate dehydratase PrpD
VIPGAVGPAVGGAKALGLGVKETAAAIGIGMSCAPLAMMNAGTDAHFLESALMCLQGVMAAEMAKAGLRGNPDITRFLTNYLGKERVVPEKMVEDLGKRWILREIAIKKYPCCVLLHRYIDSVIELRKQHNLSLEGVKVIEVHASPGDVNCNRPDPKDENDMQFSFQHTLAAAMLRGDVGLKDMSPEAVSDSKLKEGRTKVNFVLHPELSSLYLEAPTRVVIKTNDGREFSRERQYAIGGPEEPLTAEQHRGLYYKFTQGILKEGDISRTADMILNLEKLKNVKELNEVLSTARK